MHGRHSTVATRLAALWLINCSVAPAANLGILRLAIGCINAELQLSALSQLQGGFPLFPMLKD
jgi:hypothetical protein